MKYTYIVETNAEGHGFQPSACYNEKYATLADAQKVAKHANLENERLNCYWTYRARPVVDTASEPTVGAFIGIDVAALVEKFLRDEVKALGPDTQVRQYLPFLTSVSEGATYFHIRNESAYPVETKAHIIEPGDTLCARGGNNSQTLRFAHPTCPGCLAKANNIVVTHLMHYMDLTGGPRE